MNLNKTCIAKKIKYNLIVISVPVLLSLFFAYLYIIKTKPTFQGEMLVETGVSIFNYDNLNNRPTLIMVIERSDDLQSVLEQNFNSESSSELISVKIPKGSDRLISIKLKDSNTLIIDEQLKNVFKYIYSRQEKKIVNLNQYGAKAIMPEMLSLKIGKTPVAPRKLLIFTLALFSGLIVGLLFIVFKSIFLHKHFSQRNP